MIRQAKFENFKGLRDVEITFESRFTVLVGPNGSGKTSVLRGINTLLTTADRGQVATPFDLAFTGDALLDEEVRRGESAFALQVVFETEAKQQTAVRIAAKRQKRAPLPPEKAWRWQRQYAHVLGAGGLKWKSFHMVDEDQELRSLWPECVCLHLDPMRLMTASVPSDTPFVVPFLTSGDGTGLASYLAGLALSDRGQFALVVERLKRIVPAVEDIRFRRVQLTQTQPMTVTVNGQNFVQHQVVQRIGEELLFDFREARNLPATSVSEGTILSLGIIAALQAASGGTRVILLDDLEHGLHPKAQYELVTLLKKFLDEFPDLQIIATSHSPYILDRLEANEVLVTELAEDGSVVIAPLTAHPTYPKWSESMTPGEFWSHTGEGWVKQLKREPAVS